MSPYKQLKYKREAFRIPSRSEIMAQILAAKQAEYDALSQDTRQLVLDCINSGFTIGQARDWAGVSLDAVCEVINHNIVNASYLRQEVA